QAEDGIRDFHVTGVQTCALPIWAEDHAVLDIDFERSRRSAGLVPILIDPEIQHHLFTGRGDVGHVAIAALQIVGAELQRLLTRRRRRRRERALPGRRTPSRFRLRRSLVVAHHLRSLFLRPLPRRGRGSERRSSNSAGSATGIRSSASPSSTAPASHCASGASTCSGASVFAISTGVAPKSIVAAAVCRPRGAAGAVSALASFLRAASFAAAISLAFFVLPDAVAWTSPAHLATAARVP